MTNNQIRSFARGFSTSNTRQWCAAVLAATALCLGAAPAGAGTNIVGNPSFETPSVNGQQQTYNAGSNALAPWTVGGNSIDVIKNFWVSQDGFQSIDLDGNAPGSISQDLNAVQGRTYTLTFKYSSHPTLGGNAARMTVEVGPKSGTPQITPTFTFAGPSTKTNMNWQTATVTVPVTWTGTTTLTFRSLDGANQNYGIALDNVQMFLRDQAALVFVPPSSLTFGNTATLTATGGSGTGALSFGTGASTGCSVSGSTLSVTNASGTCSVTATKAGDAQYDPITSPPVTVALVKANQNPPLAITAPTSLNYGVAATMVVGGGSGTGALTLGASGGCSLSGTTVTLVDATVTCTLTASKAGDNNYNVSAASLNPTLPGPLATPVIFRAVNAADNVSAVIVGRVDATNTLPITVQAFTAPACTDGVLMGAVPAGSAAVTTDGNGYFAGLFANVPNGSWVAVEVTTPSHTARSACIVSSADNDSWPKALRLVDTNLSARDYIDVPGRSRWYKFTILPGQRVTINLSGLPADYDIAAFKDIGAAFLSLLAPANTAQLTKLSAEYAPAVFSPAVFSPAVFSPAVFSPDAYAPAVFSTDAFSPAVFSPAVFSPAVFSPAVFSPAVFSPAVFSPAVFSPAVFSPAVFSPAVFSPAVFSSLYGANGTPTQEFIAAFSSAQTRSIIGVSATPGTGDELVIVNTFNNTGDFYVRVVGRGGAYSTAGQFTLDVAKQGTSCVNVSLGNTVRSDNATFSSKNTVILTDGSVISASAAKLDLLKVDSRVNGFIVDVNDDQRVKDLKAQALANPSCPYAVNLVAEEIKRIVDSHRASNALRYVVIAGNDSVIPFFRYPDQSLLGQESGYVPPVGSNTISEGSLRNDMVLSQDAYGAGTQISVRTSNFPIPGLAVGRLVETPADMAGVIDAFIASPLTGLVPSSGLVSGYDFLSDAATAVAGELTTGGVSVDGTLIAPNNISPQDPAAWKATDLGQKLLGSTRNDVIFLAGHFSANSALAADFTTSLFTSQLEASTTNFTNAIVFSAGCHSGYNIADGDAISGLTQPLDWAQAFARKGATLIAGTGYQYGDTDFLEYSERIYANFARQLRAGNAGTAVSVGEALVKAKLDYLATTPDIRGIHEKALLEATLFGLPMLGVNMSAGRGATGGGAGTEVPTAVPVAPQLASLGLKMLDKTITPNFSNPHYTNLKNVEFDQNNPTPAAIVTATWYSDPLGAVVTNPAEPVLPLYTFNIGAADSSLVVRGVGFREADVTDSDIVPLTGAPTTELRGVHVPFVSPVFYPMRTWTVNYFGALGGSGGTNLLVTPAQHRAKDIALGTSTLRKFDNLKLRVFYSGNLTAPATSDAPSIVRVNATDTGGSIDFTAQVVGDPKAGIVGVWVTYVSDVVPKKWQSLDLKQCIAPLPLPCTVEDSTTWKATLATVPPGIRFVVQAVNGFGLVTHDDNLGVYYGLGGAGQTPTTTTLVSAPAPGIFGDTQTLTVNLKNTTTNQPIANKNVIVAIGGAARVGTTADGSGNATIKLPLASVPGTYRVIASFGGDADYLPSSAAPVPTIAIAKAPTSLAAIALTSGVSTLTGKLGGKDQPLMQEAVTFEVTGAGGTKKYVIITDYLGQAFLPPTGLPAGSYTVTASFAGNATYQGVTTSQSLTIVQQTINFGTGFATSMPNLSSLTFTITSSPPGATVTVILATGSPCTLSNVGSLYTLTATGIGACTITASAPATLTLTAVSDPRTVTVLTPQTITFNPDPLPDKTFGIADFPLSATASPSGLPVSFASTTLAVCTVSGSSVHIAGAGTCTINANQAGNATYAAAPTVTRSFTVNQATQTITVALPTIPVTVGGTFAVGATSTSGLTAFTFSSLTPGTCTVTGTLATAVAAGACTIQASQGGDANYKPGQGTGSIVIARGDQTISFTLGDQLLSLTPVTLTATATSGLSVNYTVTGDCTVSGNQLTLTAVGSCAVTAHQGGNPNYNPAPDVTQNIAIHPADKWKDTGPMTMPRSYHTATRLADGTRRVLITGGLDQFGAPTASTELYNPGTRTFTPAGNMPSKSANHSATLLNDGRVAVFGGGNSSAQIYTPSSNTWASGGGMGSNRSYHTATTLIDGRVLIVGGSDNAGKTLNTTLVYNPANGSFTNGPTMDKERERHTATLMTIGPNQGKVLIVGGRAKGNGSNYTTHQSYQFCDATSCTTPSTTLVAAQRHSHAAAEITFGAADKDVLVTGGSDGNTDLSTSGVHSVDGGTWSVPNPPYATGRRELTASELPSQRVLIAGGSKGNVRQSVANIYVGGVTPFITAASMNTPRAGHTSTSLLDASGKIVGVLVTGGVSTGGTSVNSAETYGIP